MEPFELRTVNGEAFGPKPIRPFSLRQSGVTGVNGVNEEDEEDEADEFDERIIFGSITTSWSACIVLKINILCKNQYRITLNYLAEEIIFSECKLIATG